MTRSTVDGNNVPEGGDGNDSLTGGNGNDRLQEMPVMMCW